MAMKKKFLGLAMAAMVALPATSVYATGTSSENVPPKLVEGQTPEASEVSTEINVNGEVLNNKNQSGKIQVEIPTAMAFKVDKEGVITGPNYQVKNLGANDVKIYVSSFAKKDGNIEIHTAQDITKDIYGTTSPEHDTAESGSKTLTRKHVSLILEGTGGAKVDLGEIAVGEQEQADNEKAKVVVTVPGGGSGIRTMKITGQSGKAADRDLDDTTNIDKNGTSGNFTLSFKITKVTPA